MTSTPFFVVFSRFLGFSQKPSCDPTLTARKHLTFWLCSWFWHEPLDDDE